MASQSKVFFCGPFPAPVTGQTVTTAFLYETLIQQASTDRIVRFDIVRGNTRNKIISYGIRMARIFLAWVGILMRCRRDDVVYISVDANRGMSATIFLAVAARARKGRIILHHHTAEHIDNHMPMMERLVRIAGPAALHLTICKAMSTALRRRYDGIRRTEQLSNVIHVRPSRPFEAKTAGNQVYLGFMSKLVPEKGLYLALELLRSLRRAGTNAHLMLGGSFPSEAERKAFLTQAADMLPLISELGFLSQDGKTEFFEKIDVFVFPSLYKNETQGIVNLEALAHGVPVAAYGRCCIPTDIEGSGGLVVDPSDDFVARASVFVQDIVRGGKLPQVSSASRLRFDELKAAGEEQLDSFCRLALQ